MNIPMVEVRVRKAANSVDNARDLMSKLERPPGDDPEPYDFTEVREGTPESTWMR